MPYASLKVCSNRGALEAVPEPPTRLDLARVRTAFEAAGVSVLDCRVMLIARFEREVTVGQDGRLLIKTTDEREGRRVLERVEGLLEAARAR